MAAPSPVSATGGGACLICGGTSCAHTPAAESWPEQYPFARGGFDPMEGQIEGRDYVVAPHAISDPELGRKPYGAGDKVPWADAVKYGLVTEKDRLPDPDAPPAKGKRAKKGPAEDRARKKAEDR